jgi:hypothetical protein
MITLPMVGVQFMITMPMVGVQLIAGPCLMLLIMEQPFIHWQFFSKEKRK